MTPRLAEQGQRRVSRVLVYGVTGFGKTTLARQMSELTGLPWHSVDDLTWESNWVIVPINEQHRSDLRQRGMDSRPRLRPVAADPPDQSRAHRRPGLSPMVVAVPADPVHDGTACEPAHNLQRQPGDTPDTVRPGFDRAVALPVLPAQASSHAGVEQQPGRPRGTPVHLAPATGRLALPHTPAPAPRWPPRDRSGTVSRQPPWPAVKQQHEATSPNWSPAGPRRSTFSIVLD
jgi:hypothetical protein